MKNSEKELEKPDWKQWIPFFGVYEVYKANYIEKAPAINDYIDDYDENHPIRYYGSMVYHGLTAGAIGTGALYGLVQLIEKLS